jgi:hypothetical protein
MDEYERLVSEAFRLGSDEPFSNKSATHARVIGKYIFLDADKEVCLYSDQLPGSVIVEGKKVEVYDWADLVEAATTYLDRSPLSMVKIVVADEQSANASAKFLELAARYQKQVSIRWGAGRKGSNFMVNDSNAFRYEYEGNRAIACADDVKTSKRLLDTFRQFQ